VPTEAPTPVETTVCAVINILSMKDIRPPCNAFASIGSIGRRGRHFLINRPVRPRNTPPMTGTSARSGEFKSEMALKVL